MHPRLCCSVGLCSPARGHTGKKPKVASQGYLTHHSAYTCGLEPHIQPRTARTVWKQQGGWGLGADIQMRVASGSPVPAHQLFKEEQVGWIPEANLMWELTSPGSDIS